MLNFNDGPPPEINLFNEKNNGLSVLKLITEKLLKSVHDISSGGILVTLSEMCTKNMIGAKIKIPKNYMKIHEYLFGEDQSRYIIEIEEKNIKKVNKVLKDNNIFFENIGKTQKNYLEVENKLKIGLNELNESRKFWFENYFNEKI